MPNSITSQWSQFSIFISCTINNTFAKGEGLPTVATTQFCLTFIGPCVVIYFYSKTNEMHQFLKFILFCSNTLHVSDGLYVHHQESKTVHTASGVCQRDSTDCLLAGTRWNFV